MHKTKIFSVILLTLCTAIFISGCANNKEELLYPVIPPTGCDAVEAKFSSNIKPIILTQCAIAGCHNASSGAGGTVLETYAQIVAKIAIINQRCVVEKTMPPTGPLTAAEIANISCWISAGTPNN